MTVNPLVPGRAYCTRSHDGALVGAEEEAVLWVPGRLLLEASRSAELAHWLTDSVLRGGLLPSRLPPAAAARQWGAIYMAAEPPARSCFRICRLRPFSVICLQGSPCPWSACG